VSTRAADIALARARCSFSGGGDEPRERGHAVRPFDIIPAMGNHADASPLPAAAQRGVLITLWGAIATALCLLATAILAPLAALFAALGYPRAVSRLSRLWAWLLIRLCAVKVEIDGLQNLTRLKSYILACNHQSFFDIFAICAYMPGEVRFIAKRELLQIPVIGYAMRAANHIIVHRQAGGKEIRKAIEIARMGYNIVVFAEGHRFSDNQVHEFQDGAAWLAILTKLPVVPMAISGSGAFFPRLAKVVVPGGKMRMTIGEPIATEGLKNADRGELTRRLEQAVRATFVTEVR
jgi:1-acyl-sn-glycerol-3-phosphate acyltransferase